MLETMVGNGRKARPPTIFCPTREWRSRVVRAPSLGESLVFFLDFPATACKRGDRAEVFPSEPLATVALAVGTRLAATTRWLILYLTL
jgi:hypothetical protein